MPHIIDGRKTAERSLASTATQITALRARGITPGLAVVLVGDHPASQAYVRSKDKTCRELGMHSRKYELPRETPQDELLSLIRELNADPAIHGILVQSPPPPQIDERLVVQAIDPRNLLVPLQREALGREAEHRRLGERDRDHHDDRQQQEQDDETQRES